MELETPLEEEFRLVKGQKAALKRLGIITVGNLLYHFPARYTDVSELRSIGGLSDEKHVAVYGRLTKLEAKRARTRKLAYTEGEIEDATGKMKVIWWNQPFIGKTYRVGTLVKLDGSLSRKDNGKPTMSNPEIEIATELPVGSSDSLFPEEFEQTAYPVYPESRGITSRWMYHALERIFASGLVDKIDDPIPADILKKYNLPDLKTALFWIHRPKKLSVTKVARKRFSFEEIFTIQLSRIMAKQAYASQKTFQVKVENDRIKNFENSLPFELTEAQKRSVKHITGDLAKNEPMTRLLEGDVGSGKTAVAALASYAVIGTHPEGQNFGNLQVAYMAPTEVLAKQLFENFIEFFSPDSNDKQRTREPDDLDEIRGSKEARREPYTTYGERRGDEADKEVRQSVRFSPIQIALITGSECRKFPSKTSYEKHTKISKSQLLKWVENGEIAIVIGTHSLIHKTIKFKHLALAIIDEQHRFGVKQRHSLIHRDKEAGSIAPHLLSMTATPIPRTLALTIYGDLDLTLLDQMPKGRKPVKTEIVAKNKRDETYEKVRKELEAGRQAYVICPRIDEPDPEKEGAIQAKSVKAEAERLKKKVFPEYTIDTLHSKETAKKKDEIMDRFAKGETDILVSTTVVEVGVNVPNATVIIIEGAERFGLAQLHQLRGRVIRSEHQAYCYVFTESGASKTKERLKALKTAKNGFELAELDLGIRGAGELSGKKQWGLSDIGMEAIKNIKMVEAAREEAQKILADDPKLKNFPLLIQRVETTDTNIHFE